MKEKFNEIVTILSLEEGVHPGKMMSSPALKCNGKVFTFYYQERMCFKLEDADIIIKEGIPVSLLSPFKSKPPLKGWFWIDTDHSEKWLKFSKLALKRMRS